MLRAQTLAGSILLLTEGQFRENELRLGLG
jgi:hypothetical protein